MAFLKIKTNLNNETTVASRRQRPQTVAVASRELYNLTVEDPGVRLFRLQAFAMSPPAIVFIAWE
jgi:hypothetical protein